MPIFKGNKLIRDNYIEVLAAKNITVHSRIVTGQELQAELRSKLIEEANEVAQTKNKEDLMLELADVLEVVDALCHAHDISITEVQEVQAKKRAERGGFFKGILCTTFEVAEDNQAIMYYRSRPT